ncbi:hypothetical protein ABH926_004690 [Catenulispora sp. GP43]|uniref:hypothetical protein n=1 Tax=Catenulispora sp. GP43 TaxID=3156263 RepID=UPI003510E3CE
MPGAEVVEFLAQVDRGDLHLARELILEPGSSYLVDYKIVGIATGEGGFGIGELRLNGVTLKGSEAQSNVAAEAGEEVAMASSHVVQTQETLPVLHLRFVPGPPDGGCLFQSANVSCVKQ